MKSLTGSSGFLACDGPAIVFLVIDHANPVERHAYEARKHST
jgi:hypothetical protein